MSKIVNRLTKKKDGDPSWFKIAGIIAAAIAVALGAPTDLLQVATVVGS